MNVPAFSDHSIQVEDNKKRFLWLSKRWLLLLNICNHSSEVKITVIKGKHIWDFIQGDWLLYTGWLTALCGVTDPFLQGDWPLYTGQLTPFYRVTDRPLYTGWLTAFYRVTDHFIQGDWPLYTRWPTTLYRVTNCFIQGDCLLRCHLTQVWLYFPNFSHRPFFFHLVLIYLLLINNGNGTEWSPIWSVIIWVIDKIGWLWSWSLICLLLVWLQAELDNTKSCYQFIKTTTNLRKKGDITDTFSWKNNNNYSAKCMITLPTHEHTVHLHKHDITTVL